MKTYPAYVYSHREDITRANMRAYDRKQDEIYKKCLELNPNYHGLHFCEQIAIRDKAAEIIEKGETI